MGLYAGKVIRGRAGFSVERVQYHEVGYFIHEREYTCIWEENVAHLEGTGLRVQINDIAVLLNYQY